MNSDLDSVAPWLVNPAAGLLELDRLDAEERFSDYIKLVWPLVVPDRRVWNWSFDAMCEVAEDITAGILKRVIINVPPGWSKTLIFGTFWPSWEWGPKGLRHLGHVAASHSLDLAKASNVDCRTLITHPVYQALWGPRVVDGEEVGVRVRSYQAAKERFLIEGGGFRQIVPLEKPMGWRGHRVVIDDPNVVDEGEAQEKLVRKRMARSFPTRLKDQKRDAMLLVQQRVGKGDATAVAEKAWKTYGVEFEHVVLPVRYKMVCGKFKEPRVPCKRDKRTEVGELLCAERHDDATDEQMRATMRTEGGYGAEAGQLDQDPINEGGGILKREWLLGQHGERLLAAPLSGQGQVVRAWDLAGTKKATSAWTVGLKIRKVIHRPAGEHGPASWRWIIEDVIRFRGTPGEVRAKIAETAALDAILDPHIEISIPIDPGQAGIAQRDDYAGMLGAYKVHFSPEGPQPKPDRAAPFLSHCEMGSVFLVAAAWNEPFVSEGETFPGGPFVDQMDAAARGFNRLNAPVQDYGDDTPIVVQ